MYTIEELQSQKREIKSKQLVADAYREVMGGDDWENEYQWYTNLLRGISLKIYHLSK